MIFPSSLATGRYTQLLTHTKQGNCHLKIWAQGRQAAKWSQKQQTNHRVRMGTVTKIQHSAWGTCQRFSYEMNQLSKVWSPRWNRDIQRDHAKSKSSLQQNQAPFFSVPWPFHVSHFNVQNNLWAIYVFNTVTANRAWSKPIATGNAKQHYKVEPGDRVPGEAKRMAGPVLPSQTNHELATQEPAALSMLSLEKQPGLVLPASKHWMEPRAGQNSLTGSHITLRFILICVSMRSLWTSSFISLPLIKCLTQGNLGEKQLLLALN